MTWCFKDETSQYADAILDSLEIVTAIPAAKQLNLLKLLYFV